MKRDELIVGEEYVIFTHKWATAIYARYEGEEEQQYRKHSSWSYRGTDATRKVLVFRQTEPTPPAAYAVLKLVNASKVQGLAAPYREHAKREAEYEAKLREERARTNGEATALQQQLEALLPGVVVSYERVQGSAAIVIAVGAPHQRAKLTEALQKSAAQTHLLTQLRATVRALLDQYDNDGDGVRVGSVDFWMTQLERLDEERILPREALAMESVS